MTTLILTPADKKVLERLVFIRWIIYKWILAGIGFVFSFFWVLVGWEAFHNEQLMEVFGIITIVMLILLAFGLLTTPGYQRKVKQPLEEDIRNNQKIQKSGTILRIESAGRYNSNIVFLENGSTDTETFIFNPLFAAELIPGREVILDYSPCARIILDAHLLIPLTAEEITLRKESDDTAFIAAISMPCVILLVMGWIFDMLLPFTISCVLTVVIALLIKWKK